MGRTDNSEIETLREKIDLYSSLLDNCSDLIHQVTPEGKFIHVNRAWQETLGYTEDEIGRLSLVEIVEEDCRDAFQSIFKALLNGEPVDHNETVFRARDGRRITVEGRCRTNFKDGRPVSITGIFRDISTRIQNDLALRESEKRFRTLFENSSDIMQFVAPNGHFLQVNPAWLQTFGYNLDEVAGLTVFDLLSPDHRNHCTETFRKVFTSEEVRQINTVFKTKNGRRVELEGNAVGIFKDGTPVYSQCIFRDVTEKRKMEKELLKAQKLESLGVFAGGLAHDFNNLLTAVLGNISLLRATTQEATPLADRLEKIEKATLRAKGLTQQLLTFAKGGAPIKKLSGITDLVRESIDFSLLGSNIKQRYHFAPDLWPAEVDEDQLCQVLQNLAINAAQAMPEGGDLTVTGENLSLGKNDPSGLPAGHYLLLTVTDQGHGIALQDQENIFDPYFSLKENGSGLGLAVAYAIMKKHDGLITVHSVPGSGTTFSLYLPATRARQEAEEQTPRKPQEAGGHILIMDDEKIVLEVAGDVLNFLGYTTSTAVDGAQAIQLYREAMKRGRPFDAVLMDLTIPGGMGGEETMKRLLEIDPLVRGIASSGYANDPIMANFSKYGFRGVVPKPYQVEELRNALARVLPADS